MISVGFPEKIKHAFRHYAQHFGLYDRYSVPDVQMSGHVRYNCWAPGHNVIDQNKN